ncbi:MAG: 50S ribosomal protein L23 [Niastella sp.]|nr:50S ribosomal protein L23 [Niastella sp.]
MKLSDVLIKPVLSEKANKLSEKSNRYTFIVDRKANKLEIKNAIQDFYGVQVEEVNTCVSPSKLKSKYTKAGYVVGRKPAKKKAIVTVAEGETIDLYETV